MVRTIIFAIVLIVNTIIAGSLVILASIFSRYSNFTYKIITRTWSRINLVVANIKVDISGFENIKPDTSYLVIANHQSHMDIPVLVAHLPLRLTFMAKKELFKIPFFGWGMQAAGVLKIDRSNRKKAIQTLKNAERIVLENNFSVMAFPEGTRSPDGNIQSFKKGPFVMAIDTGLSILPISVRGTYKILPKKSLILKPGRVRVKIHPPIEITYHLFETRNELVEKTRQVIIEGFYEK